MLTAYDSPVLPSEDGKDQEVWSDYVSVARRYDERMLNDLKRTLDVILVFAALFTSILTNFLIDAKSNLEENHAQTTAQLLRVLVDASAPVPPPFEGPAQAAVTVSIFWYLSLLFSVFASVGAMLFKTFLSTYTAHPSPAAPMGIACSRQKRLDAMTQQKFVVWVMSCFGLLHASILLFLTGFMKYWGYGPLTGISIAAYAVYASFMFTFQVYQALSCNKLLSGRELLTAASPFPKLGQWFSHAKDSRTSPLKNTSTGLAISAFDTSPKVQARALTWLLQNPIVQDRFFRALSRIRQLCQSPQFIPFFDTEVVNSLIVYVHSVLDDTLMTTIKREGVVASLDIIARIRTHAFRTTHIADPNPWSNARLNEIVEDVIQPTDPKHYTASEMKSLADSFWVVPSDSERAECLSAQVNHSLRMEEGPGEHIIVGMLESLQYHAFVTKELQPHVVPPIPSLSGAKGHHMTESVIRSMLIYALDVLSALDTPRQWSESSEPTTVISFVSEIIHKVHQSSLATNQVNDGRALFVVSWLSSLLLVIGHRDSDHTLSLVEVARAQLQRTAHNPITIQPKVFPLASIASLHDNLQSLYVPRSTYDPALDARPVLDVYTATLEQWVVYRTSLCLETARLDITQSIHIILADLENDIDPHLSSLYSLAMAQRLFPDLLASANDQSKTSLALFTILADTRRGLDYECLHLKVYAALALSNIGTRGIPDHLLMETSNSLKTLEAIAAHGQDHKMRWLAAYAMLLIKDLLPPQEVGDVGRYLEQLIPVTPNREARFPIGSVARGAYGDTEGVFWWVDGFPLMRSRRPPVPARSDFDVLSKVSVDSRASGSTLKAIPLNSL